MNPKSKSTMVPMEVKYTPAWLTWVGTTTSCLQALGHDCDAVDVAGMSGYAFHLCINPGLCPSGPTMIDWSKLPWGVRLLGRSTLLYEGGRCHSGKYINDQTRAHCKVAFDLAKREIDAGRPCVLWGAYIPEFAIVVGIDKNSYNVKSYRELTHEPQPPIPYEEIIAPGGVYFLAFPEPVSVPDLSADQCALANAVEFFKPRAFTLKYGVNAYDFWVSELKSHNADTFGNSYNAQCYAESRCFAHEFLNRIAKRNKKAQSQLNDAVAYYAKASEAMGCVAKMFPFSPGEAGKKVEDDKLISEAVESLQIARDAESRAMEIIEKVAGNSKLWES